MITDTLTLPETIARQITIIEVESWFCVLKTLATDLRCFVQLENRVEKSAIIYRVFDGKKLGRIWENFSGVVCFEVNHLSLDFRLKKQLGIHLNCIWGENEKLLKITQSP